MPYRVELGTAADGQLGKLDSAIGASVERKILWLAENAAVVVHRRLVGMPDDLAGLCKLRVGEWATASHVERQNTRKAKPAAGVGNTPKPPGT